MLVKCNEKRHTSNKKRRNKKIMNRVKRREGVSMRLLRSPKWMVIYSDNDFAMSFRIVL